MVCEKNEENSHCCKCGGWEIERLLRVIQHDMSLVLALLEADRLREIRERQQRPHRGDE